MEVEIGKGRLARIAYGFDEISIVPSRRTRDLEDIDISWSIASYKFDIPVLASAMDGVVDVGFAIELGKLGGLAVLNLDGIQTRYDEPAEIYERIRNAPREAATSTIQEVYREPVKMELITKRVKEMKNAGIITAASLTPQKVREFAQIAIDAGLDILVIQGTVVSAEHVSTKVTPLDLNEFIGNCKIPVIVGNCASYQTALHLMRTGAAGILVGVGPGAACTTRAVLGVGVPMATAIADAATARIRYLEEMGRYVHVISDGGMRIGGDVAKAIACGADAVMIGSPLTRAQESPGKGYHWGMATYHPTLPRGMRVKTEVVGSLKTILLGPSSENDGTLNLMGALKTSMATCGYRDIKEFQKAEIVIAPSISTEGKFLQLRQFS
ncbi:MAG: GuaB3 family IMP dehydrogenase-related protein [Actinobacteria bacterium]|nr:GuaB3 family IMP dehydrogenase-related protein [Actinomycetota bacterium]